MGFEPTDPFGSTVFKTASLNHSDTPPNKKPFTSGFPVVNGVNPFYDLLTEIMDSITPYLPVQVHDK